MYKLMRALHYGENSRQNKFYIGGVGTRGDFLSAATGRGLDEIILEGYTALSANYLDEDEVYIFGFSRGAAAARAVAGLISTLGLLPIDYLSRHLKEVWQHYTGRTPRPGLIEELDRDDIWFYPPPSIRFLGLFDTVPGNSWDYLKICYRAPFHDQPLEANVDVGVQILSLDESRLPFTPLMWQIPTADVKRNEHQEVEQIWIPGVHGDVGGYRDDGALGNIALVTMIERLKYHAHRNNWFIEWDDTVAHDALKQIRNTNTVEIRNERNSLWNKLLPFGRRQVGKSNTMNERVHPLLNYLRGKKVNYKGRSVKYQPRATFHNTPEIVHISKEHDQAIREICQRSGTVNSRAERLSQSNGRAVNDA